MTAIVTFVFLRLDLELIGVDILDVPFLLGATSSIGCHQGIGGKVTPFKKGKRSIQIGVARFLF